MYWILTLLNRICNAIMRFIHSTHRSSKRARFGRKIECSYCVRIHGARKRLVAFKNDGRLVCACDRHLPQLILDARQQGRHLPDLEYFMNPEAEQEDLELIKLRVATRWLHQHLTPTNQYRKMFNYVQVEKPRRKTTRD